MLYKEANTFIGWKNQKRTRLYKYDDHIKKSFRDKVLDEGLHNPLIHYLIVAWFDWLVPAVKKSLFDPIGLDKIRNTYRVNQAMYFVTEDIKYTRDNNVNRKIRYYYSPFIIFLYLNDQLQDYINWYKEWSASDNFIPYEDKKYYTEFMDLQDTRCREIDETVWCTVSR